MHADVYVLMHMTECESCPCAAGVEVHSCTFVLGSLCYCLSSVFRAGDLLGG